MNIIKNNFIELGAAHPNICRLNFELKNEGAAHRNTKIIAVRFTLVFHQLHLFYKYYSNAVTFYFCYIIGKIKERIRFF